MTSQDQSASRAMAELPRLMRRVGVDKRRLRDLTPATRLLHDLDLDEDRFDRLFFLLKGHYKVDMSGFEPGRYAPYEESGLQIWLQDLGRRLGLTSTDWRRRYPALTVGDVARAIERRRMS